VEFRTKTAEFRSKTGPTDLKDFKFFDRNRSKCSCHLKAGKEGFGMLQLPSDHHIFSRLEVTEV